MIIMQFTDLLSIIFFPFLLLFLFFKKPASFSGHENPPNKCAQINPPEKSAMATGWIHPRLKPAEFTRRKNPPFQLAACLPEIPLPRSKSPGKTWPAIPPPLPPAARPTEQGEGAGSRPGPPTHLEQVLLLSFPFS